MSHQTDAIYKRTQTSGTYEGHLPEERRFPTAIDHGYFSTWPELSLEAEMTRKMMVIRLREQVQEQEPFLTSPPVFQVNFIHPRLGNRSRAMSPNTMKAAIAIQRDCRMTFLATRPGSIWKDGIAFPCTSEETRPS